MRLNLFEIIFHNINAYSKYTIHPKQCLLYQTYYANYLLYHKFTNKHTVFIIHLYKVNPFG